MLYYLKLILQGDVMYSTETINVQTFGSYKYLHGEFDNIKISFSDSNRTESKKNGVYKKHTHITYEAIIIEHGIYKCALNDVSLKLNEYDMLIIQPGQTHEDFLQKGTIWYTFHFNIIAEENMNFLIFDKNTTPQEQVIHLDKSAENFMRTMIKLFETESIHNNYKSFLIHSDLFKAIFRKMISLYPPILLNKQFSSQHIMKQETAKIISVFHNNLSKQPTLEELCKLCAMSKSSLHRTCQFYFNMPPRKAFLNYKIIEQN